MGTGKSVKWINEVEVYIARLQSPGHNKANVYVNKSRRNAFNIAKPLEKVRLGGRESVENLKIQSVN